VEHGAAGASEEDPWKQKAREMKLEGKTCAEIAEALTASVGEEFTKKKIDAFFKKEKEKAAKAAAKAAKA